MTSADPTLAAARESARTIADPDDDVEPLLVPQQAEGRERADPILGERPVQIVDARDRIASSDTMMSPSRKPARRWPDRPVRAR